MNINKVPSVNIWGALPPCPSSSYAYVLVQQAKPKINMYEATTFPGKESAWDGDVNAWLQVCYNTLASLCVGGKGGYTLTE